MKLPKNRAIITIPKNENLWTNAPAAKERRQIAQDLTDRLEEIAKDIPEGWIVEIHG